MAGKLTDEQRRVVTKVGPWQQRSLFDSATLRPYRKNRWRAIRARLLREQQERRQNDERDMESHPDQPD